VLVDRHGVLFHKTARRPQWFKEEKNKYQTMNRWYHKEVPSWIVQVERRTCSKLTWRSSVGFTGVSLIMDASGQVGSMLKATIESVALVHSRPVTARLIVTLARPVRGKTLRMLGVPTENAGPLVA
jgi:hypothetical protein